MAWLPIARTPIQYEKPDGTPASGYYLKFYLAATTTPTLMATDETGATQIAKCKLNGRGFPISNASDETTIFIPHVNSSFSSFRYVIYQSAADADANNFASAIVNLSAVSQVTDVASYLEDYIKIVPTFSSLTGDDTPIGSKVSITGHTTPPVGGGIFNVVAAGSYSDDGGTVLVSGSKAYVKEINEYHLDDFGGNLADAVAAAANGVLKIRAGTVLLPGSPITITSPIVIECDSQDQVVFTKTAAVDAFRFHSSHVKMKRFQIVGSISGDTSSDIVIGRNDGANGQSVVGGYINAAQCVVEDALLTGGGNRGIDWQEGPFAIFNNVHSFSHKVNNFYVSDKAFDASHGSWFTNSAGALDDGYSINWGQHSFILLKSFSDGGNGIYLDYVRGSTGSIFVELPTNAFIEFGANTLANIIDVQFWTAGKNYVDAGIGNKLTGMSLGNNSGGAFETFTRTNKILIKEEFVPSGGTVYSGGLLINQTANNVLSMGDPANSSQCSIIGASAGMVFRAVSVHPRVYDGTGGAATQDLDQNNVYIRVYILQNGQTLRINGAGGAAYTPFDGQQITVRMSGSGTVSVYGKIDGALTTDTITSTNRARTYTWINSLGFWFPD